MSTARPSAENCRYEIVQKYGKAWQFAETFNPSLQVKFHKNLRLVVERDNVSLTRLAQAYGEGDAKFWLKTQLSELGKIFKGGDEDMLNKLAEMIYESRPDLKCTEIMAFLGGVCLGEYGEIYGFDAYQIIRLLPNFIAKRNAVIDEIKAEERKRAEEEHAKRAMTYEEYKQWEKEQK